MAGTSEYRHSGARFSREPGIQAAVFGGKADWIPGSRLRCAAE
jgi:hypothetical protein